MPLHDFDNVHDFQPLGSDKHVVPEALFISSLIDTGQYTPGKYGVRDEHVQSSRRIHAFCCDYQDKTGKAPDIGLVRRKFPDFAYTPMTKPESDVHWTASNLIEEWRKRELRRAMSDAALALQHPDAEAREIKALLQEGIQRTAGYHQEAGFDFGDFTYDSTLSDVRAAVEITPGALTQATGGIGVGELWVLGAYTGVGKSWRMAEMAVAAAASGWNVHLHSLEMGPKAMFQRVGLVALGLGVEWTQMSYDKQIELARAWSADKGRIKIIPQKKTQLTAADIEASATEGTLYLIDYVGKMRTSDGKSTTDDWRNFEKVSEELQVTAQTCSIPIIAAAQLNRDAAGKDKPTNDMLGGTIALERDASCVILLSALSRRAQFNQLTKNRNGVPTSWYSIVEPGTGTFAEISKQKALSLMERDEA